MNTPNYPSDELEQFKKEYKERIAAVAEIKTHWLKDFIEFQNTKTKYKTVSELFKELNNEFNKNIKTTHSK